jgi:hypothetical protein
MHISSWQPFRTPSTDVAVVMLLRLEPDNVNETGKDEDCCDV